MITASEVQPYDVVMNNVSTGRITFVGDNVVEVKWEDRDAPMVYEEWMFNLRMKAGGFRKVNETEVR